ncbi:hypothetical protein JCM10213_003337 [Rhodosporidiobolus nylandii]
MQALLDYGSDSDSDSEQQQQPVAAPAATSFLNLSPPKSASALNLPAPKATTAAPPAASAKAPAQPPAKKQKDKGPVRILLDLPPPSAAGAGAGDGEEEGPAKKKPKLALGSGGTGGGLTGLAALLPKPKNEVKPVAAPAPVGPKPAAGPTGLDGLFGEEEGEKPKVQAGGGMFLPPAVAAKGKGKAAAKPAVPAPEPEEPAVDFFGIGSVTSAPSVSSSSKPSSSKPSLSTVPSLSAAPSVSAAPAPKPVAPPAPKQPTADDPYPGFTQLPSGEWVAKDQETYEMWMAWQAQQAAGGSAGAAGGEDIPRGFGEKDVAGKGGYVDVDEAQRARDAWATRPSLVPGKETEYKKGSEVKGISQVVGGNAKRKHQLSSLLAAAHDNRAELEDRIAQARANRKSAGNKYGF